MNFLVLPLFTEYAKLLPLVKKNVDSLIENRKQWETMFDEFEKLMKEGYDMKKLIADIDKDRELIR